MNQAEYITKAGEIRAKANGALLGIAGAARALKVANMLAEVETLMILVENVLSAADTFDREMEALDRRDRFDFVHRQHDLQKRTGEGTGAL